MSIQFSKILRSQSIACVPSALPLGLTPNQIRGICLKNRDITQNPFFQVGKMGLSIRGLNFPCQFLMPVAKSNLPVLHGRGPQDKPVNYLLFRHDRCRSVPLFLSFQTLKYSRKHTFKINIIVLSYTRNQIRVGFTIYLLCSMDQLPSANCCM